MGNVHTVGPNEALVVSGSTLNFISHVKFASHYIVCVCDF